MEKYTLTAEDLIRIGHYIDEGIPYDRPDKNEKKKRDYILILEKLSDVLGDDVLVITDRNFKREKVNS